MSDSPRAIIVGAGIVGAACAWFLGRAGWRTVVVDHRPAGSVATAAGMGHLLVMDDPPAEFALTRRSMDLWRTLETPMTRHAEHARCGTLWVAADADEMAEANAKASRLAGAGIACSVLDGPGLRTLEPRLAHDLVGGLHVPGDAIVYAPNAAAWLLSDAPACERRLAKVGLIIDGAVDLEDGTRLEGDLVVNAAGLEARVLSPCLPLRARKGHLIITERHPGWCTNQIVELGYVRAAHGRATESAAFNVQARPNGQLLLGSSRQFDVEDLRVETRVLATLVEKAERYMPGISSLKAIRAWAGLRAATPDGLPIIGRVPGMNRVMVACGHEGLGITTAMGTGELVRDLACGLAPALDPVPFGLERFAREHAHD
jgi:glycine/D-amino acid oxidase-like deaminating enzyme